MWLVSLYFWNGNLHCTLPVNSHPFAQYDAPPHPSIRIYEVPHSFKQHAIVQLDGGMFFYDADQPVSIPMGDAFRIKGLRVS